MDFFENQMMEEKQKSKKMARILLFSIIILILLCAVILGLIMYIESSRLKITLNGATKEFDQDTILIQEDGKVYISVNDIAKSLGYSYYKGEYGQASEEITKGYVQNENEVAMFEANSKKIYKTELKNNTSREYSYFYIDEPIKFIGNKLYTTPEGIRAGFNTIFNYEVSTNTISIYTLPYLVDSYTASIVNYGYTEIDKEFNNQKAILNGMIIASKENGRYGVITTKGNEIVGAKYDSITYDETYGDFFVRIGNKKGLVDSQGKTRIALSYDNIQLLDKDSELYLVENDKKQGVVNRTGDIIIYLEYDKIGVDSSLYSGSQIKNPYLLFDNCIVVQKGGKYSILDKRGNNILPEGLKEIDGVGCVVGTSSKKTVNNILTLPDYEAIIIMKNGKYGVVSSSGKELISCGLDTIYSVVSGGKTTYQMEYNSMTLDVDDYLASHGVKKVVTDTTNTQSAQDVNVTTNTATNTQSNNTVSNTKNNTTENKVENKKQNTVNTNSNSTSKNITVQ